MTNAGALVADESPIRWSRIFCTRWNGLNKSGGTIDAFDDAEYSGSVLSLIDNGEAFIKRNAKLMWRKTANSREEMPEYVERSYHEALVNALAHRDYLVNGTKRKEIHQTEVHRMNEKIAHQIEKMKKQTIGVEVEMNNIKRDKAARLAADFFGTGRYENTASRNGYMTWSAWDEQGREWKFQKDVSIAGDDAHKCEMVTPILKYEDMETLQELIRKLRKAGTKSDATRGCGVHIHIGAKGHTPQTMRNLANIMASHESLIAEALDLV